MTTFMARLLFKLTETSVTSANQFIEQQNIVAAMLQQMEDDEEMGMMKPEIRSQIEDEFYMRKAKTF